MTYRYNAAETASQTLFNVLPHIFKPLGLELKQDEAAEEGSRGEEDRDREGDKAGKKTNRARKSNGRLLLILPYLSLFAETPFVFQVPVIRA